MVGSGTLIKASWSVVVVLRGGVSGMISVLIGVSRLSPVSVESRVVSEVRCITNLVRLLSLEPRGLSPVVVFVFGS